MVHLNLLNVSCGNSRADCKHWCAARRNRAFTLDDKFLDNPKNCPYSKGRALLGELEVGPRAGAH